jgi:hypothetical protein
MDLRERCCVDHDQSLGLLRNCRCSKRLQLKRYWHPDLG